jgi:hypothetical protein
LIGTGKIAEQRAGKAAGKLLGPYGVALTIPGSRMHPASDDPCSRGDARGKAAGDTEAQDRAGTGCHRTLEFAGEPPLVDAAGNASHARSPGNARFECQAACNQDKRIVVQRLRPGRWRAHIPSRILGSVERRCAR